MHEASFERDRLKEEQKGLIAFANEYEEFKEQSRHLVSELRDMTEKAREMAEVVDNFRTLMLPLDTEREELIHFLDHLYKQLTYVGRFH